MPGGARSFHFSTGGGGNGFNFSNADDIVGEFMRSSGGGDDFDFGGFGMGGMPGGMGGMGGGGSPMSVATDSPSAGAKAAT